MGCLGADGDHRRGATLRCWVIRETHVEDLAVREVLVEVLLLGRSPSFPVGLGRAFRSLLPQFSLTDAV